MKLSNLEPKFVRYEPRDGQVYIRTVEALAEAHGINFLCPKCFVENNGAVGTHSVICWSRSRGTLEEASPGPGRWALNGNDFHDLSLDADPPGTARSVQLTGGCGWHGFVTKGEVT